MELVLMELVNGIDTIHVKLDLISAVRFCFQFLLSYTSQHSDALYLKLTTFKVQMVDGANTREKQYHLIAQYKVCGRWWYPACNCNFH